MQRKPNCVCRVCATPIYRRPSQINGGGVYCSSTCVGKIQQKPKICKICQQTYTGGKQTCSRSCANIARTGISYTRENKHNKAYRGKALKETVAKKHGGLCKRCGHTNYAILQVHHIVERHKGGKDTLSNLELLCPNCHMSHHHGHALYDSK